MDEFEYNDTNDKDHGINNNAIDELANRALTKTRNKIIPNNPNRLSMYEQDKPNVGTRYALEWSKKPKKQSKPQNVMS